MHRISKPFAGKIATYILAGGLVLGSAYLISCGDENGENGDVNKEPIISQVNYNSPSFENCGRFTTDHDIEVTAEVTDSDDGVNKVYVDEKRGAETEYTSHEMSKIATDIYSILLTGFGEQTNLTSRIRAEDYSDASTTSDIENIIIYINNAPTDPTLSGFPGVYVGSPMGGKIQSIDPEVDIITYYMINKPNNATFDSSTGDFYWETQLGDDGIYNVGFYAKDKCGKQSGITSDTLYVLTP